MPRDYTPEEANKKLPEVRTIVEKIVGLKTRIDSTPPGKSRNQLIDEMRVNISKLAEISVDLKDLDLGLVDFPSIRYGEPVCLCWKLGESEVAYWHGATEGYRGRKQIKPEMEQIR